MQILEKQRPNKSRIVEANDNKITCMRRGELVDSFEDLDVEEDREESCVLKLFEDNEFVVEAVVFVAGRFDDLRVRILL